MRHIELPDPLLRRRRSSWLQDIDSSTKATPLRFFHESPSTLESLEHRYSLISNHKPLPLLRPHTTPPRSSQIPSYERAKPSLPTLHRHLLPTANHVRIHEHHSQRTNGGAAAEPTHASSVRQGRPKRWVAFGFVLRLAGYRQLLRSEDLM